jgi:ribosomal protein S27E
MKLAANPKCYAVCSECGHRHIVRRSEFQRRTRVRCNRCGGLADPSTDAQTAMTAGMDRSREIKEQRKHNDWRL